MSKLVLLRGVPCSGKTTIAREVNKLNKSIFIIDPDEVDTHKEEYKKFSPRMTRNPSPSVKMYCYLYNKAESLIKNGMSVLWIQPWSRVAEINLTIKNLGYYLSTIGNAVWKTDLETILKNLPVHIYVAEVQISNERSLHRYIEKHGFVDKDIKRLKKTQKLFQNIDISMPIIKVDGEEDPKINAQKILQYIDN